MVTVRLPEVVEHSDGPWRQVLNRLVRKKLAMISLAVIVLIYFGGIFAPLLAPYAYDDVHRALRYCQCNRARAPCGGDRSGRLRLRHGQQRNAARGPPGCDQGGIDSLAHRGEARGDVVHIA